MSEDLRAAVMDLQQQMGRVNRNIHGENGVYRGLAGRTLDFETSLGEVLRRLDGVERMADQVEKMRRTVEDIDRSVKTLDEERLERITEKERRNRWLFILVPIFVGGAATSIFGFLTNLFQTWVLLP